MALLLTLRVYVLPSKPGFSRSSGPVPWEKQTAHEYGEVQHLLYRKFSLHFIKAPLLAKSTFFPTSFVVTA